MSMTGSIWLNGLGCDSDLSYNELIGEIPLAIGNLPALGVL